MVMSSDDFAALAQQRANLEASVSEVRRELRIAKQRQRAAEKRVEKHWRLTPWLQKVVLIIFSLAGHNAAPGAAYLATVARRRRWPRKTDEDLERGVEDLFLAVDLEELASWCDAANPADPPALEEASRVVEEWRLMRWVQRLNEERGVAPSTSSLLERSAQRRLQLPEAARPPERGVVADGRNRAWALKFRRRWGARHGAIRTLDALPVDEMRAKAGRASPPKKTK